MKHLRKVMALVLAAFMALVVATPAWAADYSITVTNDNTENATISGKTYKAFKVFDLTYNAGKTAYAYSIDSDGDGAWAWGTLTSGLTATNGVYTNTTYGLKLTPSASDPSVYVVEPTAADGKWTEALARKLADDLTGVLPETPDGSVTVGSEAETGTIDLNEAGYYAVYGAVNPADQALSEEVVAALALTSTTPDATVKPKVTIPTLDKKITGVAEGTAVVNGAVLDEAGQEAVAKIGSTVSYQLDSTVPELTGYDDYKFILKDTLSDGLDYVTDSFELTIGTDTVDIDPVILASSPRHFELTIPYNTLKTYAKGTAIKLTYKATVNSTALTHDYENNTAKLEYSSNPGNTSTNHTPDKKTYVLNINLDALKVDGQNTSTKLDGAEFKLYRLAADGTTKEFYVWDTTNSKVTWATSQDNGDTFTTNTSGNFNQQVRGLDMGTYYLLETKAPEGYNLLASPVTITITATGDDKGEKVTYTATGADVVNGVVDLTAAQNANQPVATSTIENNGGQELPSTGGMGTRILYTIGGAMIVAGGIYLVAKRRLSAME